MNRYRSSFSCKAIQTQCCVLLISIVVTLSACGGREDPTSERATSESDRLSKEELQQVMSERFQKLHSLYLRPDGEAYRQLLRATLRHARRLSPDQCVMLQRKLIETGSAIGFDGLETVWLVYQDCAASSNEEEVTADRVMNAERIKEELRFALSEPHPQLMLRLTYWNSYLERGVRGDAVRTLLDEFANKPASQSQSLGINALLSQPSVNKALCALPVRQNQFGKSALTELVRLAGCITGSGQNPHNVCASAVDTGVDGSPGSMTADIEASGVFNAADKSRLKEFCNNLAAGGGIGAAGIDDLDAFSTDRCTSEGPTQLYESEKIAALTMECFSGGEGDPVADGATSANFDRILNRVVVWPRDNGGFVASLTVGSSADGHKDFYMAEGSTEREAFEALWEKVEQNPPNSGESLAWEDGTVEVDYYYTQDNGDGTTSDVRVTVETQTNGWRTVTTEEENSNGNIVTTTEEWRDDEYRYTRHENGELVEAERTVTNEDGSTTTYDADDNVIARTPPRDGTDGAGMPAGEGGYDPNNEACQELSRLDVMPGSNRSQFFTDSLGRPFWIDPGTINPNPEDDNNWDKEPSCGFVGLGGNNEQAECQSAMLCEEGTVMNENCECERPDVGAIALMGCATANCPAGTTPIPMGPVGCMCSASDDSLDNVRPPPGPGPEILRGLSELSWNRSGNEIYIPNNLLGSPQFDEDSVPERVPDSP